MARLEHKKSSVDEKVRRMISCVNLIDDNGGAYCSAYRGCPIPKSGKACVGCEKWEANVSTNNRIVEPKVTLLNPGEVENALSQIGEFAKVCTGREADDEKRGAGCVEGDHGSSQRATHYKFHIEGVSIGFGREHLRHSVGVAHNEQSSRYVNLENFKYVRPAGMEDVWIPVKVSNEYTTEIDFDGLMDLISQFYKGCLRMKIPKDKARYVIPLAAETKVNSVFSYQALTHYANKRQCNRAHEEIRKVAKLMKQEVEKVDPAAAWYMVAECQPEAIGYCRQERSCGARPKKGEVIL